MIDSVYGLMSAHKRAHPDSHFFDSDTLKFFGETVSSMRLLNEIVRVVDSMGEKHNCYVLSSLQKKCPAGLRCVHHYFDVNTLEHIVI